MDPEACELAANLACADHADARPGLGAQGLRNQGNGGDGGKQEGAAAYRVHDGFSDPKAAKL